ncbi:MAG: EscU/YscU/HrcU family type III secretion system export apparatus switch protein [Alphaproteobacteria bacterium]|nr:EscU/YscU/HrcU family type III secretion system export apparatus switch protein [Alphaproteobacteria bacterium]
MAEGDDQESKTEEPTERRIQEAIDRGNVPHAREAVTLGSLLGILIAFKLLVGWSALGATATLRSVLENVGQIQLGGREDAYHLIMAVLLNVGLSVVPLLLVIAAGGIIASLGQNLPQAASERVKPNFSRISPGSGFKRIYSLQGVVEFGKTVTKLIAVMLVTAMVLRSQAVIIFNTLQVDLGDVPNVILEMAGDTVSVLCVVALTMAFGDIAWSRFKWRKDLRMSREDMKEEFKQSEGNPQLRARARSVARQRMSRSMFAKIPSATMVVTNPTHFAVALRYVREEGGAPVVVAKGLDYLALRIKEAAALHDVPLIENKPLARALYESVELDQSIPPELYRAVAEIIHFLQLRNRYTHAIRPS